MGKMKIAIAIIAAVFLGFFVLLVGVVQDFIAHEFNQFDVLVAYLVKSVFTKEWSPFIGLFSILTSYKIIISLTVILALWIIRKKSDRVLEIQFLFITIGGAELLQYTLRNIFKRTGPLSINALQHVQYTFPSNQSLMAITAYGFFAFIIIRRLNKAWINSTLAVLTIFICIFSGLNPILHQSEYPSDIYAGFIFGGVWLMLNIILLEVYRILPKVQY
jgi:hypothetical protein